MHRSLGKTSVGSLPSIADRTDSWVPWDTGQAKVAGVKGTPWMLGSSYAVLERRRLYYILRAF
jgi:hypothetical protein